MEKSLSKNKCHNGWNYEFIPRLKLSVEKFGIYYFVPIIEVPNVIQTNGNITLGICVIYGPFPLYKLELK